MPRPQPKRLCPTCRQPIAPLSLVEVDLDARIIRLGGVAIRVTPRQAEVFFVLKTDGAKGPVSTRQLISRVYGVAEPDTAAINVWGFICQLRKKLGGTGWRIASYGTSPDTKYLLLADHRQAFAGFVPARV